VHKISIENTEIISEIRIKLLKTEEKIR